MAKKEKDTEDLIDKIIGHIKTLSHDEAMEFACESIFQTALWAGDNDIEILGLVDCAREDIIKYVLYADNKEDDGDEWKKLISNN